MRSKGTRGKGQAMARQKRRSDLKAAYRNGLRGLRIERLEERRVLNASIGFDAGDYLADPVPPSEFVDVQLGEPSFVEMADLNHDGLSDVAYVDEAGGGLFVRLGAPDGLAPPMLVAPMPIVDGALTLFDINGDGNEDLVVGSGESQKASPSLTVYAGDGAGGFLPIPTPTLLLPDWLRSLDPGIPSTGTAKAWFDHIAMIDSPGQGETAVGAVMTLEVTTTTFTPTGGIEEQIETFEVQCRFSAIGETGMFAEAPKPFSPVIVGRFAESADLNDDGFADLITLGDGEAHIYISLGAGDPTPYADFPLPLGGTATDAVEITDSLTGLGETVLLGVSTSGGEQVLVVEGSTVPGMPGDWAPASVSTLSADATADWIVTGTMTDDPNERILAVSRTGPSTVFEYRLGTGYVDQMTPVDANLFAAVTWDVTNDGVPDLVMASSNALIARPGDGMGDFGQQQLLTTLPSDLLQADFADINGDGLLDLAGMTESGSVFAMYAAPGGTYATVELTQTAAPSSATVEVVDLGNLDGMLEILLFESASESAKVLLLETEGGLRTISERLLDTGAVSAFGTPLAAGFGSVHSPGASNFAVLYEGGELAVWDGLATGSAHQPLLLSLNTSPGAGAVISFTDLNGDGLDELIATLPAQNSLTVLANTGGGYVSLGTYDLGAAATDVQAVDFDQDGYLDLAVPLAGQTDIATLRGNPASLGEFLAPTLHSAGGMGTPVMAIGTSNGAVDALPDVVLVEGQTARVLTNATVFNPPAPQIVAVIPQAPTSPANPQGEGETPATRDFITEWTPHVLEIWGMTDSVGLGSFEVTLGFVSDYFTVDASSITLGPAFASGSAQVVGDTIQITGETSAITNAGDSEFALLATIEMAPHSGGAGHGVDLVANGEYPGPIANGVSIQAAEFIDVNQLALSPTVENPAATALWAVPFDLDDSGDIGRMDYIHFRGAYGLDADASPMAKLADFDRSGRVGREDYMSFRENYGKNVATAEWLVYPADYYNVAPASAASLALMAGTFGFSSSGSPDSEEGSDAADGPAVVDLIFSDYGQS